MAIQQGCEDQFDIGLGDTRGRLDHDRLVELIDRAARSLDVTQPPHDRGRRHRPDTLVHRADVIACHADDLSQSGHRLLDEDIARPAQHARRPSPRHHLHRQDAVSAEVEERVIDAHPV